MRRLIETGAFDRPAVDLFAPFWLRNWLAFHYFGKKDQTEVWHQYLEYIASHLPFATVTNRDLVNGKWDWDYFFIMTQVCGAPPGYNGFCVP